MEPGPHDIAWAAGLFEGEGTFHAQRANQLGWRVQLELSIIMTDRDVLDRFQEVVQRGSVHPRNMRQKKPHWKPQYVWRCTRGSVELALKLRPFLGKRRKQRLDDILRSIEESRPKPRNCACCGTSFTPTRFARQAFCSVPCMDRGKYLRRKSQLDPSDSFWHNRYHERRRIDLTLRSTRPPPVPTH